jgi:hypothetical protein
VLVSLPEGRQAMYEIAPWPLITEFRSMLQNWDTSEPNSFWQGPLVLRVHGNGDHGAAGLGSLSGFGLIRVHG